VPRLVVRNLAELLEAELPVSLSGLAARGVPTVKLGQEEAENGSLELVEPRVVADELEAPLVLRAVEAEPADRCGELGIARGDKPPVAEPEEVLRRKEAEGRGQAE
jgi:hypothetical protein